MTLYFLYIHIYKDNLVIKYYRNITVDIHSVRSFEISPQNYTVDGTRTLS